MTAISLVAEAFDVLGEGPVWSPLEQRLYWFDIKGKRLSWLTPQDGKLGRLDLPLRASAAAPRAGGGLFAATEYGLAVIEPGLGKVEFVERRDLGEGFRTNDGKIDQQGRFWWSTMDDNGGERPGDLYRTTPEGVTEKVLGGIHIPNTVSFSPDGTRLYLADSKLQTLFVHDPDDLSKKREFAHTRGEDGTPDGSAVDVEGFLWNAQWGAWRIVRYAPDGRIDRIVEVPVEQPTSCAFGGEDLSVLYVTSAREDLSEEALAKQPHAGCVFAFDPGVKGLPLPLFRG